MLFIKSYFAFVIMILANYHCIEYPGNLIRGRYNSLQMTTFGLLPPEIYAESSLDAFHRVSTLSEHLSDSVLLLRHLAREKFAA